MRERLLSLIRAHTSAGTRARLRRLQRRVLGAAGYDMTHWTRKLQAEDWRRQLQEICTPATRVLEISPDPALPWKAAAGGSYRAVQYPDFDVTRDTLDERFDVIIADQVFEHLRDPDRAARNVHSMLAEDGAFLIATPFLIRGHALDSYGDYTRWTPEGLKLFLERNGFSRVEVRGWGNRAVVKANLRKWKMYGWHRDMSHDPRYIVNVWATARR